jgi:Tfp pilus assembly protein PilP
MEEVPEERDEDLEKLRSLVNFNLKQYKKAKKEAMPNNIKALKSLVKKIMKGNKNWTPEELQLQINFPEQLEEMLFGAYNKQDL